eukprot:jgi/Astpho2/9190/e_gw1.00137.52.1_t
MPRRPLFPGTTFPVSIRDAKLIEEIEQIQRSGGQAHVGAFLRIPASEEADASDRAEAAAADAAAAQAAADRGSGNDSEGEGKEQQKPEEQLADHELHQIGTFAQVSAVVVMAPHAGGAQLLLRGHRRLKRTHTVDPSPLKVAVQHLKDEPYDSDDDVLKATVMEIVQTMKELVAQNPLYREQMQASKGCALLPAYFHDPSQLSDIAACLTSAKASTLQDVLEQLNIRDRASMVLELLKKELELCKLQADIGKRVEQKISADQRRYFLMEQLRSIKKELGMEKDDKSALVQKFRERIEPVRSHVPPAALKVIDEELDKLQGLEQASSEFNVTRNYLDWLTQMPWGKHTQERLEIEHAQQVLDEDHYGLSDVKDRILEFIAVGNLRGSTQGKILCLVGPPGVGKTSIGKSVARALDRKYYRFSVGGLSDVAEIKGHRRTYVGAMPGKMAQCLKTTGTANPLVLIDEIDKLGRGYQGDPASALLELLDPEQNGGFVDHYLDVPIDLSKVLFMCTANVLDTIPGPLLDRMEVIRISGYIASEKVNIARQYLEPQARQATGVPAEAVTITDPAMKTLISEYAREAGVRNLKKLLEKAYRKVALKLGPRMADPSQPIPHVDIEEGALKDYVGQPPFTSDRIYDVTPVGVVMGLAWTAMGGNSLYIEAASVEEGDGKGGLRTTGQLGDVMKESASIAHTFARAFLARVDPHSSYFARHSLHVHVPAGGTPKDGPSAGCTIITALLSLAMNKPVRPDLAMTGEVSLTGRILPIGGVKEKLLAARRSDVKTVLFPEDNRKDYDELKDDVKEGIQAEFMKTYDDVYWHAFDP